MALTESVKILPRAGHAGHHRLAAEAPVGADLARHARHFRGERPELVDHRVDGFLELQNLAAHVDGDLLGKIAVGDRDGDVGDVADLRREVAGHLVDGLGEFLPHARNALDLRLAAELAFGADLARDAGHLRGEHRELLDHRVDELRRAQELALERRGRPPPAPWIARDRPWPPRRWCAPPRSSAAPGRRAACSWNRPSPPTRRSLPAPTCAA